MERSNCLCGNTCECLRLDWKLNAKHERIDPVSVSSICKGQGTILLVAPQTPRHIYKTKEEYPCEHFCPISLAMFASRIHAKKGEYFGANFAVEATSSNEYTPSCAAFSADSAVLDLWECK
eukprot:1331334-Amphidinium_carterae.1